MKTPVETSEGQLGSTWGGSGIKARGRAFTGFLMADKPGQAMETPVAAGHSLEDIKPLLNAGPWLDTGIHE